MQTNVETSHVIDQYWAGSTGEGNDTSVINDVAQIMQK